MFFSFDMCPYIAIIGDIKKSREVVERERLQDKLKKVLENVNCLYSNSIASNFIITLGDEFQGLLFSGKHFMDIVYYIKKEMYPINIRFGIGIGEITTKINSQMSIGADGPGYYNARDCIDDLKKNERKKVVLAGDIKIKIEGDNHLQELSLNSIFKLMYVIEKGWTPKQREVINFMLYNEMSQTQTAIYFSVAQSNIHQLLSKSSFYAYKDAFDSVNKILEEVGDDKNL